MRRFPLLEKMAETATDYIGPAKRRPSLADIRYRDPDLHVDTNLSMGSTEPKTQQ